MRRLAVRALLAAFLSFVLASPVLAEIKVNPGGNANYDATDVRAGEWDWMKVERVYNSFASFNGVFGQSWSGWFEEYLEVLDTGELVVHEYGGGADNLFKPIQYEPRPVASIIDELMTVADEAGQFQSDADKAQYRQYLVDNHHQQEWKRFRRLGLVTQPHVPVGVSFHSDQFGSESITRVPEGYERSTGEGKKLEAFDLSGRLQRVWDPNHNVVALRYDSRGRLSEMEDNLGNRFIFSFDDSGRIVQVSDGRTRVAGYEYDSQGNLVALTDAAGRVQRYRYDRYAYDQEYWYLLGSIRDKDGTTTSVKYDSDRGNYFPKVVRVEDGDGLVTRYSYTFKSSDGKCMETFDVVKEDKQGKVVEHKPATTVVARDSYCSR